MTAFLLAFMLQTGQLPARPVFAPAADRAAALAATRAWLAALNAGDKAALAGLTHPQGMQFSVRYLPGQEHLRVRSNRDDTANMQPGGPRFNERIWRPTVLLRADLAQVWAPYSFDIDGKRSHCGIDNFTLIRVAGKWLMTNASWTVEPPSSCRGLGEPR